MSRLLLVLLGLGMAAGSVWAENPLGGVKAVKSMPIQGVKIIESDKGVFFVSENGRFVWKGPIYDMWNGRNVATMEDVDQVANRVDLKKIGVKPEELATLTIGKGKLEEVLFASPDCGHCQKLLQQALKLGDQYRFQVVLLPMGPKSMEHARQILCAKDREAAVQAMASGKFDGLGTGDCDAVQKPLQRTLVTARILGLRSVPYLIRHDGQVKSGGTDDLAGWLAAADGEKTTKKNQ